MVILNSVLYLIQVQSKRISTRIRVCDRSVVDNRRGYLGLINEITQNRQAGTLEVN